MANPFAKAIRKHSGKDPSEAAQQKLGVPQAESLGDEHASFLETVLGLIDEGKIDTANPDSILNMDIYEGLKEERRGKVDLAIPNVISLLERIMDLHARPEENASFEMKNLIETLWQMRERIEDGKDVFIF